MEGGWVKGGPGISEAALSLDSAAPCSPSCQHPRSLITVEGQSLFLNRMLVVTPGCFLFAPGHRCLDSPPTHSVPFLYLLPRWGGLRSRPAPGRVGCVHSAQQNHDCCGPLFSITPFVWWTVIATYLTFNHLLAIANLPPSGEHSILVSLLMLVSSSAHRHGYIYVSLTDCCWCFQVPRDKRLLSVSKSSDSQEDQDKR